MDARPDVIAAEELQIGFVTRAGEPAAIVDRVSLALRHGVSLGLAGESGCGKSTLLLALMGHAKAGLAVTHGTCCFEGRSLFEMPQAERDALRGKRIAMVPQNAGQALTPTLRIGAQIDEVLRFHTSLGPAERRERVLDLIDRVQLPSPAELARRYPHELSGGQQQRVAVAMAVAVDPVLLLLDEPTTGLDVTTQLHILELLRGLADQSGTAMVCVSHDIGVIARLCDEVAVMYAGRIVETGRADDVLVRPRHPYARGLLASIPRLKTGAVPEPIPGRPPTMGRMPQGCRFVLRCDHVQDRCRVEMPPLRLLAGGAVACHFAEQLGPWQRPHDVAATALAGADHSAVLRVEDIAITYDRPGLLDRFGLGGKTPARAVDGVSFTLEHGEVLGLVGESGSGKSTILRGIAGLWPLAQGAIVLADGSDLAGPVDDRPRDVLRRVQLVFQNPDASLNPRRTVREILARPLAIYHGLTGQAAAPRLASLMADVRLGEDYLDRLPSQLSGGEKQRIAIARAFAAEPEIILCDEVTSALDVSVQASILNLLADLCASRGVACILVSHDLAVVRAVARRIAVLYRGRLCEIGPAAQVALAPRHPYTRALVGAVLEPEPGQAIESDAALIEDAGGGPGGCSFRSRCPRSIPLCAQTVPDLLALDPGHAVRCHRVREAVA